MRFRILEAFAQASLVVTITVGPEGIDACPGVDVMTTGNPEDFARSVINLLQDKALQRRLSENGHCLVEGRYDLQAVLGGLDKIYNQLTGTRKS